MNKNVPREALSQDRVQQWARVLDVSDKQLNFILFQYDRFIKRHNAFLDREAEAYYALSADSATCGGTRATTRRPLRPRGSKWIAQARGSGDS